MNKIIIISFVLIVLLRWGEASAQKKLYWTDDADKGTPLLTNVGNRGTTSTSNNNKIKNSKISYTQAINLAAKRYDLDPDLLKAVISTESNFNRYAVSPKGAKGLMQLMPSTAKSMGVKDVFNVHQNIDGGAKYLRILLDKYDGNLELALAAYNAGPGAVEKYNGIPPYKETKNYVRVIKKKYNNNFYWVSPSKIISNFSDSKPITKKVDKEGKILFTNIPHK